MELCLWICWEDDGLLGIRWFSVRTCLQLKLQIASKDPSEWSTFLQTESKSEQCSDCSLCSSKSWKFIKWRKLEQCRISFINEWGKWSFIHWRKESVLETQKRNSETNSKSNSKKSNAKTKTKLKTNPKTDAIKQSIKRNIPIDK